ncbi:MAG: TMEM175 family protein [Lysobacterales bacterium]
MGKGRLEAFSDGVIAIIITIMVLELKVPHGSDFASLRPLLPVFLSYVLSFVYVGIYWNNHHHMLHATRKISGSVLWANLHLLFWLSLFPFATAWMGENHFTPLPTAMYGVVLLMAGIAYVVLQQRIIAVEGRDSLLAIATGTDFKGKVSVLGYVAGIGLSFVQPWLACTLYVLVALLWLVPDRRIESRIEGQ